MFCLNFSLQRPGSGDSTQEALQDVDDWDLTELNTDWDVGESGDDVPSLVRHLILSLHVFDSKHFVDPDLIPVTFSLLSASLQTKPPQPLQPVLLQRHCSVLAGRKHRVRSFKRPAVRRRGGSEVSGGPPPAADGAPGGRTRRRVAGAAAAGGRSESGQRP